MRLAAFEGEWSITRRIEDLRGGMSGALEGVARFTPEPEGGLLYAEEGWLRLGGAAPAWATRRYLWRDGDGGAIEVHFEDGRLFHRFRAGDPDPTARHDCAADLYEVRYDFRRWPHWSADWRVRGPRKNYAMTTTFAPAGRGRSGGP